MFKRVLVVLLLLIVIGVAGVFLLGWHSAYAPVDSVDASSFDASTVARGKMLASAGYCATCHTASGGARNAGGLALKTGFGTIYSTNITPDVATGIGAWSEKAFARAMREGISRDGSELFPAFPFDHFTKLTDADVAAIYAYLMSQPAVNAPAKSNELPFPLNIRSLQAGWKLLYLDKGAYEAQTEKGEEWNRGAYLAEGLGHCGACHTPRNALGAEQSDHAYAGALIEGWQAPALTADNPASLPWTVDELTAYLRSGATALHGVAAGPMSDVVHQGLSALPDSDIHAIAVYFADQNGSVTSAANHSENVKSAMRSTQLDTQEQFDEGADLYRAACSSCHYNSAAPPSLLRPELAFNSALRSSDPTNLIQVILHGVGVAEGIPDTMMPPFAASLSDKQIEALAGYLRSHLTDQPPWSELSQQISVVRKSEAGS